MENKKACTLTAFLLAIAIMMQVTSISYTAAYYSEAGVIQTLPIVIVYADKEWYVREETIYIEGYVTDSLGNPLREVFVGIEVDKPDGSPVFVDQQATNDTGWFETQFKIPTGTPLGLYTVTATCSGSQANDTFTVGWLGDLDRDGDVDEDDLWYFCEAFIDYYKIHVKDPLCDFDNDCDIDEDDLWTFCAAFIEYWKHQ